jgi:hypothetical protein
MDQRLRHAERQWQLEPDVDNLLTLMGLQQHLGREEYLVNFQTIYGAPCRCNGESIETNTPCVFGFGHQDINNELDIFDAIFPYEWNEEEGGCHKTYDVYGDISNYEVGSSLEQLVTYWAKSINPQYIIGGAVNVEYAEEFSDILDEEIVPMRLPSELDEGELERELIIREAFVVSKETHDLITRIFSNVVDHYIAPGYLHDAMLSASASGEQGRRLEAWGQYRAILNTALISRLSMYRQMAMLKITTYGTELVN